MPSEHGTEAKNHPKTAGLREPRSTSFERAEDAPAENEKSQPIQPPSPGAGPGARSPLIRSERPALRPEDEFMRDVMAALASAATLNQTLEIILVNLRNVIPYDRAGFVLLDENRLNRDTRPGRLPSGEMLRTYPAHDPLVAELLRHQRPIRVADVSRDTRFDNWPDQGPVRGWLGAPLQVQDEVIGFLSLGSLQPDVYTAEHAEILQTFTGEVSQVLERVWRLEESHRKSEELETLSRMTVALGQVESRSETVAAIVAQATRFFGAERGTFLVQARTQATFIVRFSQIEGLAGMVHPAGADPIWESSRSGQSLVVNQPEMCRAEHVQPVYQALCQDMQAVVFIPLKTEGTVFGVLAIAFADARAFTAETISQYNAVTELIGAALRRAIFLERLEEQNRIRTQHLATLYRINALASEPLDLQTLLEQALDITLEALNCSMAALHLVDAEDRSLHLAIDRNLPAALHANLESLSLRETFWRDLLASSSPLLLADVSRDPLAPEILQAYQPQDQKAFLAAPIRAKNHTLGLLTILGATNLECSIEDITLFTTIADQVGGFIERARLISQAEQTAVMQERQRVARELHDSVTQLLYSQVLFAGAGQKVLNQGNTPLAEEYLARLGEGAQQALKEMRLLVYELRPTDFLSEGLGGALQRRVEAVEKRTGLQVHLELEPGLQLAPQVEMGLYGIAQEALNNTLKHAHARTVHIRLFRRENGLQFEIMDDGEGFEVETRRHSGGMGLENMRDRAAALGGLLGVDSSPGQGTRIHVLIEGKDGKQHSNSDRG